MIVYVIKGGLEWEVTWGTYLPQVFFFHDVHHYVYSKTCSTQ